MKPLARSTGLVKQVVGQETLVYDTTDASARRLNAVSAAVWRHSTGRNSVEEIAVLVAAEVALPADADAVAIVWKALDELEEHGLLVPQEGTTAGAGGFARRDVLRTLAALPIFPSIDRIFAPTMASAASTPPDVTASATATASASASMAVSASATQTPLPTQTRTPTGTATPMPTQTRTPSATPTQSGL